MKGEIIDLVPHLDPELGEGLKLIPPWRLSSETLPFLRSFPAIEHTAAPEGFVIDNLQVPGKAPGHEVSVRVYRPVGLPACAPVLLWMHGGGFVMGNINTDDPLCLALAGGARCAVVSVDYRLAPEHPYPAALDDCNAALEWIAGCPDSLGTSPERIAIAGISAGGCLAAALALKARDEQGPELCHQFLIIPVTDDRLDTKSARRILDPRVWDLETARRSWMMYLGEHCGDTPAYAAPNRCDDLAGLPGATVFVEEYDVLRDEAVSYAERLQKAGVATKLVEYPGTFHGHFGFVPDADISKRTVGDIISAVVRVFLQMRTAEGPPEAA